MFVHEFFWHRFWLRSISKEKGKEVVFLQIGNRSNILSFRVFPLLFVKKTGSDHSDPLQAQLSAHLGQTFLFIFNFE